MNMNTQLNAPRELTLDELLLVSGGGAAGTEDETVKSAITNLDGGGGSERVIEEITVTYRPPPSVEFYIVNIAPRTTVSSSSNVGSNTSAEAGGFVGSISAGVNQNKGKTNTRTFVDTDGDGKPDSGAQINQAYKQFKDEWYASQFAVD